MFKTDDHVRNMMNGKVSDLFKFSEDIPIVALNKWNPKEKWKEST